MPGFLSEYEQTTRLTFGANEEWWVEVRRFLNRGDFKYAQQLLLSPVMRYVGDEAETKGEIDSGAYLNELVFRAIVGWNLTDSAGADLPLAPDDAKRASIDRLPSDVFDRIAQAIEGATPKKKEKAASEKEAEEAEAKDPFPAGGPRSALSRRGTTA